MDDKCCLIFHAISDKTRLKILKLLKNKEICVSDICKHFNMTQPSISHHLDILKRADLVESEKKGKQVFYTFKKNVIIECCGTQFEAFGIKLSNK